MTEKKQSISAIREIFAAASETELPALYLEYEEDSRAGVQNLIQKYQKQEEALKKERERTEQMKIYEHKYEDLGWICGIDEVGRGPLAGPVVAGAVILPRDSKILYLNDSKQLTAKKTRRAVRCDHARGSGRRHRLCLPGADRRDQYFTGNVRGDAGGDQQAFREAGCALKRCGENPAGGHPPGTDHQGRCQECFDCGGKYCCEGDKGPPDGRVRQGASGLRFCIEQGLRFGRAYRCFKRNRPVTDPPAVVYRPFRVKAPHQKKERVSHLNQREVGTRQESRAAEYLESLGYHILVRNFRCRFGEIDLIAKQDDTYIFIEVKYRTGRTAGDPTSAVDGKKQKKISKTADYYRMLHQIPMDVPCRFDVVAETPEEIRVYANAFYYQGSGW